MTAAAESLSDASPSARIQSVKLGLDGGLKVGRWAAATATVNSSAAQKLRLVVESVDPDGNPTRHEGPWRDVPEGESNVEGLFQLGRVEKAGTADVIIRVSLENSNERLATVRAVASDDAAGDSKSEEGQAVRFRRPLLQSALMVGVLGNREPIAALAEGSTLRETPVALAPFTATDLPSNSLALESLDVLLVMGLPALTDGSKQVLQEWVRRGGHLLLCAATEKEAFGQSPWDWGAIPVEGSSRLRELSGLERLAGKGPRIPIAGSLRATKLGKFQGDVRVTGLDGPLLVRVPYGFGRISFLGVDVDRAPLAKWEPLGDLLRKMILRVSESTGSRQRQKNSQIATPGLSDLATQLRVAQDEFSDVHRFSTWSVMGLIIAYVIFLGPLDYFLVHRLLKRPQLTWITFPALVLITTFAAVAGARAVNGDTSRVNQIDVVDIDIDSGMLRGRSSLSFYSPSTQRYALDWQPATSAWSSVATGGDKSNAAAPSKSPAAAVVWDGIPEDSFGGMYRAAGGGVTRPEYRITSESPPLPDLPVPVWATKTIVAQWEHPSQGLALSQLTSPIAGQLSGSLIHYLPGELSDWVLAYGNRVYLPRPRKDGSTASIPAGTPWTPGRIDVFQRELNGYLTGTIATRVKNKKPALSDEVIVEQTPWNPQLRDPLDVLRMITFHDKAEGAVYTGLANDGLRQLELSPVLDFNRAVLFGQIEVPAGTLRQHTDADAAGATTTPEMKVTTVVRLVLPVVQTGTTLNQLPNYNANPTRKEPLFQFTENGDAPAEAEIPTPAPETPKP
jgi:hypothetical protein